MPRSGPASNSSLICNATIEDLVTAVHSAMRGELVCSPRIAALLFTRVGAVASKQSGDRDHDTLTRREHKIVSL